MNSVVLPVAGMALGLYTWFIKKTQRTTKSLCQTPGALLAENSRPACDPEWKQSNQQDLRGVINRMGN